MMTKARYLDLNDLGLGKLQLPKNRQPEPTSSQEAQAAIADLVERCKDGSKRAACIDVTFVNGKLHLELRSVRVPKPVDTVRIDLGRDRDGDKKTSAHVSKSLNSCRYTSDRLGLFLDAIITSGDVATSDNQRPQARDIGGLIESSIISVMFD